MLKYFYFFAPMNTDYYPYAPMNTGYYPYAPMNTDYISPMNTDYYPYAPMNADYFLTLLYCRLINSLSIILQKDLYKSSTVNICI